MRFLKSIITPIVIVNVVIAALPRYGQTLLSSGEAQTKRPKIFSASRNITIQLFTELEEFARLVDIAYCVGVTGIYVPFKCASRCDEFPGYELVDTWNTGPLMSDSCGYIALDHQGERIIVAFRGTYSITNTIVDLATVPQEYIPYPGDSDGNSKDLASDHNLGGSWVPRPWRWLWKSKRQHCRSASPQFESSPCNEDNLKTTECSNCTVHMGFMTSWQIARRIILPHLKDLHDLHSDYKLHLVGHSLGGAVAALAALELEIIGWNPTVTTFGEPRIGNLGLREYLDEMFHLKDSKQKYNEGRYRRVTHINDPVPLLPLSEWGFKMHAGEIYISKEKLHPDAPDLWLCSLDEDTECVFGAEASLASISDANPRGKWGLPARYRMWQLFFAHRDYFWRLGLCIPGGDPVNWER